MLRSLPALMAVTLSLITVTGMPSFGMQSLSLLPGCSCSVLEFVLLPLLFGINRRKWKKMLMLEDFDLNSVQRYTDLDKDIFKLTMLDQEIIFRKQVHDLHRLHGVQKSLTKDLPLHECQKYNSWKANQQSRPQETRLPADSVFMLGSNVSSSKRLSEEWKGNNYHKFQQRHFDRQLLPYQYINPGDDKDPNKRKVLQDGNFSDPLDLRLSLSLGVAKGTTEDTRRSWWHDKKTNTCPEIVIIDLEESTDRTSEEDAKHPPFDFATKVTYSGGKRDLPVTITSDPITSSSKKKDLSYEITESNSFIGDSKCYQDRSCSNHGSKRQNNMSPENFLTRKRQFLSYGVGQLDLNDAIAAHPSTTTSSSGGFSGLVSRSQETLCPGTFDLNLELNEKNECETSFISPVSESRTQLNISQDHGRLNPAYVVATPVGCKKTEEGDALLCLDKIQIIIDDEHPDESPTSGKSSCISDIESRPVKTSHSGIEPYNLNLPASDQFSGTNGRSQVAEMFSSEPDQRSSDSNDNKEKSAEVDDLVQIAADSLINLSLESSVFHQESSTQPESKEHAQYPSDFFELMTLELTESCVDEYSVSPKPFEVSEQEGKDFGIKLRRGRRMKDFQRDILPSLASLSRHEICEDINILEGVLRSREYKKMRAKMGNGDSWCAPTTRGKRSRLNNVGRKTFR